MPVRRPRVVYWNNIPSPYAVARLNAVAARGNMALEVWFCSRTEPDRSWAINENDFQFPWRYVPGGKVQLPGLGTHYYNVPTGLLARSRPDLLVSLYAEPAFLVGWLAARTAGIRVAFRYLPTVDNWLPQSRRNERIKHELFTHIDGFKTSGPAGHVALEAYGVEPERIHTVTQSIDVGHWRQGRLRWRPERDEIRKEYGAQGTTYLYVGRLVRGKGIDDLLVAYGRLTDLDRSLLVAGDGVDEPALRALVRELGLRNVRFLGFVDHQELPRVFAAADALVFPTYRDKFGLVVEEAMASGLPIISSDAAGDVRASRARRCRRLRRAAGRPRAPCGQDAVDRRGPGRGRAHGAGGCDHRERARTRPIRGRLRAIGRTGSDNAKGSLTDGSLDHTRDGPIAGSLSNLHFLAPRGKTGLLRPGQAVIRVLNVVHYPVFGGPHNQALRLAGPLAARGFETIVVVPASPGNAAERLIAGGLDVRIMPLHRIRATSHLGAHIGLAASLPAEVGRLRGLMRTEDINIVQIGGLVNPHAAIAARLEHIPVVWQLLDTRAPRPVAMAAMLFVRALADVVMSTGVAVAQAHPGYPAIADRVIPYFPPVDLAEFAPRPDLRATVRSAWGIPQSTLVVGCIANINPQKGIVELVRAFATVRSELADVRLVLVGAEYSNHADYSAAVRAEMMIAGLVEGQDVTFVGERNDVERQLAGMDVIALAAASRSEGITTAILEAMAVGVPVVATEVGALRDAIADDRTGFLVPPGQPHAFAVALRRLVTDPTLRERMGREARHMAEAHFSADTCAEAHVRAYVQALGRHGKGGWALTSTVRRVPEVAPSATSRVVDGINVFVGDSNLTAHDEIDHEHTHVHEIAQARHLGRVAEQEFETIRPHGTPRLYRFLLAEKSRRAIEPIRGSIAGASALSVCGRSGMDAEYLARAGADVTTSDLSLGAATRARARAGRYGLRISSIVADVEDLPFFDQSVDVVAVHDGLHHLDDPYAGLSEMARVARRWVLVTEPARASITRLAIRLGLALETERAGNHVGRMEPAQVAAFLESRGYVVLRAERYAMYYPHHPGTVFSLLSRPFVFPIVRAGWRLANALVGRFGNKMVVVAERQAQAPEPRSRARRD